MYYYLAPMEGITTYVYRGAYHKYFYPMDKYFTPFLVPHSKKGFSAREMREIDPEHNKGMRLVPQIMSNQADDCLNTMQKLTALSIVGRLENGLDTRIGASLYDDGIDLSGGETQKIVATRTLLDNADIWIFDEPVAAMYPSSEYSFFNTVLEEDDKSKTMIFVSHRLKIASKMNRIIYLENGKIVGIGTHQQLMTGCEKYRRYYVSWLLMEND